MTFEETIKRAQLLIRERGFMSASELAVKITTELASRGVLVINPLEVLEKVDGAADIHRIEYTNQMVGGYRIKDLFFFNPNLRKEKGK